MPTFNVEIDLGNSAFEDSSEVARILRNLADRVEVQVQVEAREDGTDIVTVVHNGGDYPIRDINGARVGSAWIEDGSGVDVEEDR